MDASNSDRHHQSGSDRPLVSWRPHEAGEHGPDMWAVAGGKGGVGKSVLAANLAVAVARRGLRCLLIDADLGGGNQHTLFGIEAPRTTLDAFLQGDEKELSSVATPTRFHGLSLVYRASDALGAANPKHSQKQKFIRHLRKADADVVILDLGAGTSFNTLDLFLTARVQLVVTTPELTAIQNAYGFIKCAQARARHARARHSGAAPDGQRVRRRGSRPRVPGAAQRHQGVPRLRARRSGLRAQRPGHADLGRARLARDRALALERGLRATSTASRSCSWRSASRRRWTAQDRTMARGLNEELRVTIGCITCRPRTSARREAADPHAGVREPDAWCSPRSCPTAPSSPTAACLPRQQQVEYQHRVVVKAIREQRLT